MEAADVLNLAAEIRKAQQWHKEVSRGSLLAKDDKDRWERLVSQGISIIRGHANGLKELGNESRQPLRAKFYAAALDLEAGKDVQSLLCEIAEQIEPQTGAVWLGNGRITINGTVELMTAANDQLFIETLLTNGGKALTSDLASAGVTNPSVTAKRLREMNGGTLAGYITTPNGKKNAGYSTTIQDGRGN